MKINYLGYSIDGHHPADRRRFLGYAQRMGAVIVDRSNFDVDALILTPLSDFTTVKFVNRKHTKVILDIVDGYLEERSNFIKDYGRKFIRQGFKSLMESGGYKESLVSLIRSCDAVVVASPEQAASIRKINDNVHVILDSQEEIPLSQVSKEWQKASDPRILWHGQASNLKHILPLRDALLGISEAACLTILTQQLGFRFADRFLAYDSESFIKKGLDLNQKSRIRVMPWSIPQLIDESSISTFAAIPIDLNDNLASMKSENKLLELWRLGLPVFVSPIASYSRVLRQLGLQDFLVTHNDWQRLGDRFQLLAEWPAIYESVRQYILTQQNEVVLSAKWGRVFSD